MIKKEFSYRGKSLEELKQMSIKEFAELVPSRQRRSLLTGFDDAQKIFLKKLEKKQVVKTHCRDIVVLPMMVGRTIKCYRGNEFVQVIIEPEMIGYVLGELVLTRRKVEHHAPGVGATKSSGGVAAK
jgi:small subunit ribosomal protein S19